MKSKSVYTDAQWTWMHDRFKEGYPMTELAEFAGVSFSSFVYHWHRLHLRLPTYARPPLNKKEFNALGLDGE